MGDEHVLPVFPGEEGFGAAAIGGRGGRIIEVTNLNDRGPGSFRAAVTARGPRIVVFRIAGIIELQSRIDIGYPYLTVAGHTAPGGGVTLKGSPEGGGQMLRIRTHDVVLRHLRIRSGAHGQPGHGQINVCLDPLPARVINNVMYNWSSKCSETHDAITVDWIANYFKPGPLSSPERLIVHNAFFKGFPQHRFGPPSIYLEGNVNAALPEQSQPQMYTVHYEGAPLPDSHLRPQLMDGAAISVSVQTAEETYRSDLENVGANIRLDEHGRATTAVDSVDTRVLQDVRNGTGNGVLHDGNPVHYRHPDDVGGYPQIDPGVPYADDDHDGMADVWERMNGLDPADASDAAGDLDGDGYTNVEEFLNAIQRMNTPGSR